MALQGFVENEYLAAKLAKLQQYTEWQGKTTDQLKVFIANAGFTPEQHYQQFGWAEGLAPNNLFNAAEYKLAKATTMFNNSLLPGNTAYASIDAALAAFNAAWTADPYLHYIQHGSAEGVNPSNAFDESSYFASKLAALQANHPAEWADKTVADVQAAFAAAGLSALGHYQEVGKTEGIPVTEVPLDEQVDVGDISNPGETFTLTQGLDTIAGTTGNDTINALAFNSVTGADTTTLQSVDTIDGGAGTDTLNIEVKTVGATTFNALLAGSIKNVEIVNIDNTQATAAAVTGTTVVDASKFEGVKQVWQIGIAAAGGVTNLGDTTTAGFKDTAAGAALLVTSTNTATKAAVALNGAGEGSTITFAVPTVAPANGGALNSITVSGTVKDSNLDGVVADTNVGVTVGRGVQSLAVDTAVGTVLTVTDGADATKTVTTVDASASTGGVTYVAANTVGNINGGSGKDVLTLATAFTTTLAAASVNGGAGDDTLNVNVTNVADVAGATVTVAGGEGKDTINLNIVNGATKSVGVTADAGAGDDKVDINFAVKTTDVINGGDGVDTVVVLGKAARVADDFIVFNKVLTNFETLQFKTAAEGALATALDASLLSANYTTLDFFAASFVDNVETQSLVARGALTAEAKGYINVGEGTPAATAITYAGTLNITEKLTGTVQAHAETVNLTVEGGKANAVAPVNATLTGEAKAATVTLSAGTDTKATVTTTDDTFVASSVTIATGAGAQGLMALASLTLSGNGAANITNADTTALVTVDASGLNSVDITGKAATGLNYSTTNTKAEVIKLGGGLDAVTILASTYTVGQTKMDTVEGLNLVVTGGAVDATKGDTLTITGLTDLGATGKFTTTQTDLDLALLDAAKFKVAGLDVDTVAFHQNGNTYIYEDASGDSLVTIDDILVKLVGTIDLDALVIAV